MCFAWCLPRDGQPSERRFGGRWRESSGSSCRPPTGAANQSAEESQAWGSSRTPLGLSVSRFDLYYSAQSTGCALILLCHFRGYSVAVQRRSARFLDQPVQLVDTADRTESLERYVSLDVGVQVEISDFLTP